MGTCTATSSRKVIACEIAPLSLLLNTPHSGSSQRSLVQEAVSSTPVSSQNALTSGETPTSHAFPFGHCHRRLCVSSLTLCKAQEYTLSHRELSTFPNTSSHIINCPMLRTVGVGEQMSCPWTSMLHCQMVRRHLASERAAPLAPTISGVTSSYQGILSTAASERPSRWCQLFPASPPPRLCLYDTLSAAPGFLQNVPALPRLKIGGCCPPATLCGGLAYAEFGSHSPMPRPDRVRPGPSPTGVTGPGIGENVDH